MIDYITQIDFNILYWIQENLKCAFLDFLMPLVGTMQDLGIFWICIGLALMIPKKTRYCGMAVLIAMLVDTIMLEYGAKFIFTRVRPCNLVNDVDMLIPKPNSYSFPSNHSASAFAAAVAVAMTVKSKVGIASGFVVSSLIAFSRVYCFVHYPSDVIVGVIAGSLIGFVVCVVMKKSGFIRFLERKNFIEKEIV